jgi:hypothetical protein
LFAEWVGRLVPPAVDLPRLPQAELALRLAATRPAGPAREALIGEAQRWLQREQRPSSPLRRLADHWAAQQPA